MEQANLATPPAEYPAIPVPTQHDEDMAADVAKRIVESLSSGDNPIAAAKNALDANRDGKLSIREIKHYRWLIVIFGFGFVLGAYVAKPSRFYYIATFYWALVVTHFIAVLVGLFLYWLFDKDIAVFEDRVIERIDNSINK